MTEILLRPLRPDDSIAGLTGLLHAAYARLAALGFNYTAVDQDEAVTRERIGRGECCVAVADGAVVGTLTFYPAARTRGHPWWDRPEVASLGQFAVAPAHQAAGIGRRLMGWAEERARATGADELSLDTAEGARHLVAWYERLGYRTVGHARWEGKVYRSVIMSKALRREAIPGA